MQRDVAEIETRVLAELRAIDLAMLEAGEDGARLRDRADACSGASSSSAMACPARPDASVASRLVSTTIGRGGRPDRRRSRREAGHLARVRDLAAAARSSPTPNAEAVAGAERRWRAVTSVCERRYDAGFSTRLVDQSRCPTGRDRGAVIASSPAANIQPGPSFGAGPRRPERVAQVALGIAGPSAASSMFVDRSVMPSGVKTRSLQELDQRHAGHLLDDQRRR